MDTINLFETSKLHLVGAMPSVKGARSPTLRPSLALSLPHLSALPSGPPLAAPSRKLAKGDGCGFAAPPPLIFKTFIH